jgi:hypothetical protein
MPGYGIAGPDEGTGLLPWSWAVERLIASHDYWLATTWPDGRPHVMPVWGVWLDDALWFSSGLRARKARNLAHDPRCTLTTDNPFEPVVVDGAAERTTDLPTIARFAAAVDAKYGTDYGPDFYDPDQNACLRVAPTTVFALDEKDFTGSPTRWWPAR